LHLFCGPSFRFPRGARGFTYTLLPGKRENASNSGRLAGEYVGRGRQAAGGRRLGAGPVDLRHLTVSFLEFCLTPAGTGAMLGESPLPASAPDRCSGGGAGARFLTGSGHAAVHSANECTPEGTHGPSAKCALPRPARGPRPSFCPPAFTIVSPFHP
jgi:hypothetical protein